MIAELWWLLVKVVGFVVIMYQWGSLVVLLTAAIKMKGEISVITAHYDHWWGTYYSKRDHTVYWMIPFIGLMFDFTAYWRVNVWLPAEKKRLEQLQRRRSLQAWGDVDFFDDGHPLNYGDR